MLSQNVMLLITVVSVIVGVLGVLIGVFPFLKKKGYPIEKTLNTAQDVLQKAGSALDVAGQILPANPAINILKTIENWAKIAVGNAEQLYHAGDIRKDERATVAEQVVLNVLKELNITVDDNKKALIDAAIKEAVNSLGHAPADVKTQQEAQEQLQQANKQLQNENTQLKQTISNVQNTVQKLQQVPTQTVPVSPATANVVTQ